MHSLKYCVAIFAVVVIGAGQSLQAEDTPEQARLRELLRKSDEESASQPAAPAPAKPTPVAPGAPVFKPAPAPATPPPVIIVEPKAIQPEPTDAADTSAPTTSSDDLRKALHQELSTSRPVETTPSAADKPAPIVHHHHAATAPVSSADDPKYKPVAPPTSGMPVTKEQKLDDLLQRYKQDLITPEEYHAQRTAILSEP